MAKWLGEITKETELAFEGSVETDSGEVLTEVWVPKSQILTDGTIKQWFADMKERKGWKTMPERDEGKTETKSSPSYTKAKPLQKDW